MTDVDGNQPPLVSVVVPAKRAAATLARTLDSLQRQTYRPIEVIVADGLSGDGTPEIARTRGCRVISGTFTERSAQLNAAIAAASGRYVYRVDADVVVDPTVVEEAVSACESGGLDAVLIHNGSDPARGRWARARWLEREMYRDDDLNVAARFVRTGLLQDVGGFDESLVAGEDYDLHRRLIRAGARVGRIRGGETHLGEPRSLREVWQKHFYYGRTLLPYLRKHGRFAARQLGPARPAFRRHWRRLLGDPKLTALLAVYLAVKYAAGFAGLVAGLVTVATPRRLPMRPDAPAQNAPGSDAVEAVIVSWNSGDQLPRCVQALSSSIPPERIHVVDNASSDGSPDRLPDAVHVVRLPRNEGYGRAVNRVLDGIRGEVVLILNPDTRVPPSAVAAMLRCLGDPGIAAVQPLLVLPGRRLDSAGSFLTWTGFLAHPGHGQPLGIRRPGPVEIFGAKGAALMVRTKDLRDAGGFDPSFFLYFEDSDLCWRLWLRGRRVVLCPEAEVLHLSGHSVHRRPAEEIEYHSFRNRLASLLKNLSAPRLLAVLPLHLAACLGTALVHALLGRPEHAKAILAALLANARDLSRLSRARRAARSGRKVPDRMLFRLSYANGVYLGPGLRFVRSYLRRW